jgi:methylenetetrahydrofolate reductase (NADPH)
LKRLFAGLFEVMMVSCPLLDKFQRCTFTEDTPMSANSNAIPPGDALSRFLESASVEVVSTDKASIDAAASLFKPGTEVFIANLPRHKSEKQIDAAISLRKVGLVPVPHIVARNLENEAELASLLRGLRQHAGVDTALVLGGDRDKPAGTLASSLQLLETGLFEENGIRNVFLACYPEGHARINQEQLFAARTEKLAAASARGLNVTLVSQFCFDPEPIIAWTRTLRAANIHVPFRVGVAGPASKAALLKFALFCGVGPSLRALKERDDMARNMLAGETPEELLRDIATLQMEDPGLNIIGAHFFTFGSLARTAQWIQSVQEAATTT